MKLIIISFLSFFFISSVYSMNVGDKAKSFKIKSGDDKELSYDMIKGRLIAIFYEDKDYTDVNTDLKNELGKLLKTSSYKNTFTVNAIDCSDVYFESMWRSALRKNSKKHNITLYGDWDGKMLSDYGFKQETTNFMLVNQSGDIIYKHIGPMNASQRSTLLKLVSSNLK